MENKKPIKDEDGYYTVQLGTLIGTPVILDAGTPYEKRIKYDAKTTMAALKSFGRRVSEGYGCGEARLDKLEDETVQDYISRITTKDVTRLAFIIKEMRLVKVNKNGVFKVEADIKPIGPFGDVLKTCLDDPEKEVIFGLRALVKPSKRSTSKVEVNDVINIISYDWIK